MRILCLVILCAVLAPGPCMAAAAWKAKEQECVSRCPQMPRFGGIEDDAAWKERMKRQDQHDSCQRRCIQDGVRSWALPFRPHDSGARSFFKRNGHILVAPATKPAAQAKGGKSGKR